MTRQKNVKRVNFTPLNPERKIMRKKRDYDINRPRLSLNPELPKDLWLNVQKEVAKRTGITNPRTTQTIIYVFEQFIKNTNSV